jgi:predicted HTH domain antitoxin
MAQFSIEINDQLIQAIKLPPSEVPSRLRRELAVRLYEKGLLTFGKARELAGMSRWEFHDLLGNEGIHRRYDVKELGEDLKTIEETI